jgi:hypothetical protein
VVTAVSPFVVSAPLDLLPLTPLIRGPSKRNPNFDLASTTPSLANLVVSVVGVVRQPTTPTHTDHRVLGYDGQRSCLPLAPKKRILRTGCHTRLN